MSRNLLHKNKIQAFKQWLDENNIPHREGRGEFQVLQVQTPDGKWGVVYDRMRAKEHYTVTAPLESLVRRFIKSQDSKAMDRDTALLQQALEVLEDGADVLRDECNKQYFHSSMADNRAVRLTLSRHIDVILRLRERLGESYKC